MSEYAIKKINEAQKSNSLVLFVGAGISRYLGLPSWKQLVLNFYHTIGQIDSAKETLIKPIESDQLPLLDALKYIKEYKKDIYADLKKAIDVELNEPFLHKKLWQLSPKIITTNYDKAFENSNFLMHPIVHNYGFELSRIQNQNSFYLKLHGSIENVESCVLFEEDFERIYNQDSLVKTVFENLIINNTFLFIGFSLSDPYVKKVFEFLNQIFKGYLESHFIITTEEFDLAELNIKALKIENWNESFEKILNSIVESNEQNIKVDLAPTNEFKNITLTPKSSKAFTGRQKELKEFGQAFANNNIICVEGLGGIGKTEFVAKFIEQVPEKNVIWFECKEDSQFESLIDGSGYSGLLKSETNNRLSAFLGYKELIERDRKVVILDNFQELRNNAFSEFLQFLRNSLKNCKLIILDRKRVNIEDVEIFHFPLLGLENDALEYAKKIINLTGKNLVKISDQKLLNICSELNGHPFAIKLAIQLLVYEENENEILDIIKKYKSEKEKLSNRLLSEVFNHPKSTNDEKDLLTKFSVFRNGVTLEAVKMVFGENYQEPLKSLMDKLMITRDRDIYACHHLVREFAYEKLNDRLQSHILAVNYYKSILDQDKSLNIYEEALHHLETVNNYEDILNFIEQHRENMMACGYYVLLLKKNKALLERQFETPRLYINMADLETMLSKNNEKALYYSNKALSLESSDEEAKLEAKITVAELEYSLGRISAPFQYFNNLYEDSLRQNFEKGKTICLSYIGDILARLGNRKEGERKMIEALQLSYNLNYHAGINHCGQMLGNYYMENGQDDKAFEVFKSALEHFRALGNTRQSAKSENGIAVVLGKTDKYEEALKIYYQNLKLYEEIGDVDGIASSHYNIAACLRNQELQGFKEHLIKAIQTWESIQDYPNLATAYNIYGVWEFEEKHIKLALDSYFKSIVLSKKVKDDVSAILENIVILRNNIDLKEYDQYFSDYYNSTDSYSKSVLDFYNLSFKTTSIAKLGRNDPCHCGSGKKYKHCHGKSL